MAETRKRMDRVARTLAPADWQRRQDEKFFALEQLIQAQTEATLLLIQGLTKDRAQRG